MGFNSGFKGLMFNVQQRSANLKYRIIYSCASYGHSTNTLNSMNSLDSVKEKEFTFSVTNLFMFMYLHRASWHSSTTLTEGFSVLFPQF